MILQATKRALERIGVLRGICCGSSQLLLFYGSNALSPIARCSLLKSRADDDHTGARTWLCVTSPPVGPIPIPTTSIAASLGRPGYLRRMVPCVEAPHAIANILAHTAVLRFTSRGSSDCERLDARTG